MAVSGGPGFGVFMRVDVDVGVGARRVMISRAYWKKFFDDARITLDGKAPVPETIAKVEKFFDEYTDLPKGCQIVRVGSALERDAIDFLIMHPSFSRTEPFAEIPIIVPMVRMPGWPG